MVLIGTNNLIQLRFPPDHLPLLIFLVIFLAYLWSSSIRYQDNPHCLAHYEFGMGYHHFRFCFIHLFFHQ